MRALIGNEAVFRRHRAYGITAWRHCFRDFDALLVHELEHFLLVLMPVEGHAQERQAVGIAVRRVKIEIVLAVALARTVDADAERAAIVVRDCFFPSGAPARRAMRHGFALDGGCARTRHRDIRAADKSKIRAIEFFAVEIVKLHAGHAAANERIELAVIEEHLDLAAGLIGIVAAHHAGAGLRIVGLADAREQQQACVVKAVGRQHHDIRGLLDGLTARVDVGDTGGLLAGGILVDLDHVAQRTHLEIFFFHQRRQHCGERVGLRARRASMAAPATPLAPKGSTTLLIIAHFVAPNEYAACIRSKGVCE